MNTSFLEYYKVILSKVSFDQSLLNKEYSKALNVLSAQEAAELSGWLKDNGLSIFQQGTELKNTA